MSKTLTRTVHVINEDGSTRKYIPGESAPDGVTNPKAFAEVDDEANVVNALGGGERSEREVEIPDGEPSDSWTHAQLDAYAEANGVTFSSSSLTKEEKVGELG